MSAPKITLYQYPGLTALTTLSPPCGKVHMALRFKGLDFRVRNLFAPYQTKRVNPRGRVPVLRIDGETVVDSTDIVSHLDTRFPTPPLEPPTPLERAHVKILEDWADEVLYFYGVWLRWCLDDNYRRMRTEVLGELPVPMRWLVPFFARREVRRRMSGQGVGVKEESVVRREISECLDTIVRLLRQGPWLVGERISRADLAVAAIMDQWRLRLLTPGVAAEVDDLVEIVSWLERVHEVAPDATGATAPQAPGRPQ